MKISKGFIWFFTRLIVPLNFVLRYSRSEMLKIYLVFYSLNRTFELRS